MIEERLKHDVEAMYLIGPKNKNHYDNLCEAEDFIIQSFSNNFTPVKFHEYIDHGKVFHNIIADIEGQSRGKEVLIVGAHYDTQSENNPSENATALAILLEIARYFSITKMQRTLRIIAFSKEEKPFNKSTQSGQKTYEKYCKNKSEKIIGMICLEALGPKSSTTLSLKNIYYNNPNMEKEAISNKKTKNFLNEILPLIQEKINFETSLSPKHPQQNSDQWAYWEQNCPAILLKNSSSLDTNSSSEFNYEWLSNICHAIKFALREVLEEQ